MKPREQSGVVDSSLNVYGVEGLKVCGELDLYLWSHDKVYDSRVWFLMSTNFSQTCLLLPETLVP